MCELRTRINVPTTNGRKTQDSIRWGENVESKSGIELEHGGKLI